MKRALAAALVTVLLALAPPASAANNYAGWHWRRTANPFSVSVIASVTPSWANALQAAATEWSQSPKFDMVITPGSTTLATRTNCGEIAHAIHVCNADYGAVGWAGLTELAMSGQHIVRMRIRLNDHYTPARFRRLVSCHELGHGVGLSHRTQSSSCMKPGSGSRPHPDAQDFAELNRIYAHSDGKTPAAADTSLRTITIYDWAPPQ